MFCDAETICLWLLLALPARFGPPRSLLRKLMSFVVKNISSALLDGSLKQTFAVKLVSANRSQQQLLPGQPQPWKLRQQCCHIPRLVHQWPVLIPTPRLPCSTASDDSDQDMVPSPAASTISGQPSLLDSVLLAEWEDRAEQGLFRYDVTACPTKLVPGPYGFIAQCNEGRASKKRPTEFRVDQVSSQQGTLVPAGIPHTQRCRAIVHLHPCPSSCGHSNEQEALSCPQPLPHHIRRSRTEQHYLH